MSRFVRPDTTRLALEGGDALIVKTRLNAGEQRAMFARLYLAGADGQLRTNPLQTGLALITVYLVDWTLTGDDGAIVPIRGLSPAELGAVLDNLDPESFTEIKHAIEAHERETDAAREAEKKKPGWRERILSDLVIARHFGWRLEWVAELDPDVYQIIVDELNRDA